MEKEALISRITRVRNSITLKENVKLFLLTMLAFVGMSAIICVTVYLARAQEEYEEKKREEIENYVPDITVPSMDFMLLSITKTRFSINWDLLIRIPYNLGFYACLEGDLQVFIVYVGVTIATPSIQSYNLIPWWPKLIKISLIASEEDMDGVIVKHIIEDVKQIREMRFGSRLLLPDCRYGTTGKMNYECEEATLRLEPGSQRNASLIGNHPTCYYLR